MSRTIYEKLEKNVCKILCDDKHGTGFLISNELILTAFHVIDGCNEIKVKFDSKTEFHTVICELVDKKHKELDVVILRLKNSVDFYEDISILDIPIKHAEKWCTKGFPKTKELTGDFILEKDNNCINSQSLTIKERNDIQLDFNKKLDNYEGLSGAPIIINNSIVGIIKDELLEKGTAKELRGLSIKYFRDLLEKAGIDILNKTQNLFKYALPTKDNYSVERSTLVKDILDLLNKYNYVLLHGMTGIGKTYISIDVANEYKEEYSLIWINGKELFSEQDLYESRINECEGRHNIISLMKESKVLLIIDNLTIDSRKVISLIQKNVKTEFKLIVTSQVAEKLESNVPISFLDKTLGKQILDRNLEVEFPSDVLSQIYNKIGGHPFLLNQINMIIKEEKKTWADIFKYLESLVSRDYENYQKFYNKLFQNHLEHIPDELYCMKWVNDIYLDLPLLNSLIGEDGVDRLEKRGFFNIKDKYNYKLHDIVFNSLSLTKIDSTRIDLKEKLKECLSDWYTSNNSNYFRVIYSHKNLIKSLITKNKYNIFSYSYLNSLQMFDYKNKFIHVYNGGELEELFENYTKENYFELFSWVELVEKTYLFIKNNEPRDNVDIYLNDIINQIEYLLELSNLPDYETIEIENHLAKHYKNHYNFIGNKEKENEKIAIKIFRNILKKNNNYWVGKLHLSRILRFIPEKKTEAEELVREILAAYEEGKEISSTVVLSAYQELTAYSKLRDEQLMKFVNNFDRWSSKLMVEKFDMPYEVLSALSYRIHLKSAESMINLTNSLPLKTYSKSNISMLFAIGQIYFHTSRACLKLKKFDDGIEYAQIANSFFEKIDSMDNHFQLRTMAENYLILNKFDKSEEKLLLVKEGKKRDCWWKFTYSKILSLLNKNEESSTLISEAIDESIVKDKNEYSFYIQRGDIKIKLGICPCDDFNQALSLCDEDEEKNIITEKLKNYKSL